MSTRFFSIAMLTAFAMLCAGMARTTAAEDAGECSRSRVETRPESVIAPCSEIIADETKAPAERGYALFIRGMGYHNTKRFDLAGQDYDSAIKLTPTNEDLLVSRANIAFRGDRYPEGVSFLQRALALNPSNGRALRTVGTLNENVGAFEEANRYYMMALAANPTDAYALLFRCKNLQRQRRFDDALKDADALVAIAPEDINRQGYLDENGDRRDFHIIALKTRARIYQTLAQFERAERDLNAAVAYRRAAASLSARGFFLAYRPGRQQEAFSDLQEAIALGSDDFQTFFGIGMIHVQRREFRDALADFDHAVSIDPYSGDALRMRARMHRELDQADRAFDDMMQAVTIDQAVLKQTVFALRAAGYWRSSEVPAAVTADFEDAVRACMLDKLCN
ncbi:tetratricopeptide repeat protein [Bradyrhizobium sp. HKCCYLS3077]|uniref:tetratricopeptide repeat protein n=1 Tax=Bradyrhizobium sp. HKCCYLS3077 TaxID=3420761 RepID=UPI003EC0E190